MRVPRHFLELGDGQQGTNCHVPNKKIQHLDKDRLSLAEMMKDLLDDVNVHGVDADDEEQPILHTPDPVDTQKGSTGPFFVYPLE